MNWQEVCADPLLRDLPYKIELNEWGQIVMSPASNRHGLLRALLVETLRRMRDDGMVITECSLHTTRGVKVADVAWLPAEFLSAFGTTTPYPEVPALCVEIVSPAKTPREMAEKRALYFAQGAREVWLCDEAGGLTFHAPDGPLPASRLFPGLHQIESVYLH